MKALSRERQGHAYFAWFTAVFGMFLVLGLIQSATAAPANSTTLSKELERVVLPKLAGTSRQSSDSLRDVSYNYGHGNDIHDKPHSVLAEAALLQSATLATLETGNPGPRIRQRDSGPTINDHHWHNHNKTEVSEQHRVKQNHTEEQWDQIHDAANSTKNQPQFFSRAITDPTNSSQSSPSPVGASLAKRSFVPTAAQADAALTAAGFDGSKFIYFSNAAAGAWAKKLGRTPISTAYGTSYLNPDNLEGPYHGWDPTKLPEDDTFDQQVWASISAAYSRRTTGTTYVVLNPNKPPRLLSIWLNIELEILRANSITIFSCNVNDLNEEPKQIWPPPQQGSPPVKA